MSRCIGPRILARTLLAALIGSCAAPLHAQLFESELYGRPEQDVGVLLEQAEAGDARAAFLLGTRYAAARGEFRDDAEAARWFRKAAEGGLAEAQYNLGVMHAVGRGVPRDLAAAATWYRLAARQGNAEAQYNLGTLYSLGEGVGEDPAEAARWLTLAAEQGLPEAQYNLGVLTEHGRGVAKDPAAALTWYRQAADGGYEPAAARVAALAGGEPAGRGGVRGPDWVAAQDPDLWTVQIMSDTDERRVRAYMERHALAASAAFFTFRKGTRTWYSVIHGTYPSRAEAKRAAAALPPALRAGKPWVRRLAAIQGAMGR